MRVHLPIRSPPSVSFASVPVSLLGPRPRSPSVSLCPFRTVDDCIPLSGRGAKRPPNKRHHVHHAGLVSATTARFVRFVSASFPRPPGLTPRATILSHPRSRPSLLTTRQRQVEPRRVADLRDGVRPRDRVAEYRCDFVEFESTGGGNVRASPRAQVWDVSFCPRDNDEVRRDRRVAMC